MRRVTDNRIATEVGEFYRVTMSTFLCGLFALVAVLLMPFGMSVASAAPMQEHQQMTMSMEHCPEPASSPHPKGALADCTMACASALPAAELTPLNPLPVERPLLESIVLPSLTGIEMEIATPPPRLS